MVMMKPAEAARAPPGATYTTTGVPAAIMRETMVLVDSSRPPGVRKTMIATSAPARVVRLDPHTTKNDEGRTFPFTDALEQLLEAPCR